MSLGHGYEYAGVYQRLVITPLTERCYLTFAQVMRLHLISSPLGPAGTGKTETIKDLARCVGRHVVVTNIGPQTDMYSITMMIQGLVSVGAWGGKSCVSSSASHTIVVVIIHATCVIQQNHPTHTVLDEINRGTPIFLSSAAAMISSLFNALRANESGGGGSIDVFTLANGSRCALTPGVALFTAMNPPSYGGRISLPPNLKRLMRTVVMMAPDSLPIMEARLSAAGFKAASTFARKIHLMFTALPAQLTHQPHYHFGLRAQLTVTKHLCEASRHLGEVRNPTDESALVASMLRKFMEPQLSTAADVAVLKSLLVSLFPRVSP